MIEVFSKMELRDRQYPTPDLLISDRTDFIFEADWLEKNSFPKVNVHPSLLPLHRGSYPIFWSALLGSKWGVTLHEIEEGVDNGPILKQVELDYDESSSFRDLYYNYRSVSQTMLQSFVTTFALDQSMNSIEQLGESHLVHKKKDTVPLIERLSRGWDTSIKDARRELSEEINYFSVRKDFI